MAAPFHAFRLVRRGNSPEEYEDAFAGDATAGRYAVADGATESCFAGLWARLLVEEFVHNTQCGVEQWAEHLSAIREQWWASVSGRPLPWYGEAQLEQGAFAAFLGLTLAVSDDSPPAWQAVAVGDTCLFHTRGATLLAAFPLSESNQFGSAPDLVGSRLPVGKIDEKQVFWRDGSGQHHDRLWMMTDALARWCLSEHEAGANPWGEMESLLASSETNEGFAAWIEAARTDRGLHNDDVTLLVIDI